MTQRYRALSPDDYTIAPLDVVGALYDRRSGQTHLVASPIPEILTAMQGHEVSVEELIARLSAAYDLPADEDHTASIGARLREMTALGLVELLP